MLNVRSDVRGRAFFVFGSALYVALIMNSPGGGREMSGEPLVVEGCLLSFAAVLL